MTMQVFEVMTNIEWYSTPSFLYTDPDYYDDIRDKALAALASVDGDEMTFYWADSPKDSGFLKIVDDYDEEDTSEKADIVATYDDEPLTYVDEMLDFECRFEGPHLKIVAPSTVRLIFYVKHTDDELWVDLK